MAPAVNVENERKYSRNQVNHLSEEVRSYSYTPSSRLEGQEEGSARSGEPEVREPGQNATITFTRTSDSVGEWEIGCFEEEGAHWDDGMQGTLTVVDA